MTPRLLLLLLMSAAAARAAETPRCDAAALRAFADGKSEPAHARYVEALIAARSLKLKGSETVCQEKVLRFVSEGLAPGADEGGRTARWAELGVQEQGKRLVEAEKLYKALDEAAAKVKAAAPPVAKAARFLGLLDDKDAAAAPDRARETQRAKGAVELEPAIKGLYEEIPLGDQDEEGKPGALVKAWSEARKALAAHLDDVKSQLPGARRGGGGELKGVAIDFVLLARMDAELAKELEPLARSADAGVGAFVAFVADGEPMKGEGWCRNAPQGACVTVAEWLKALKGDSAAATGTAASEARRADGKGPGGVDKARAEADRMAEALHPKELDGLVTAGQHKALTSRGWRYEGVDEEGALYKRDHPTDGPINLHVSKGGNTQFCQDGEGGTCYMKDPFGEEGNVLAGGGTPPAKGESGKTEPAGNPEQGNGKKEADVVDNKELEKMALQQQNALVLYADGDCKNDATGGEYRYCPWVTKVFNELHAKHQKTAPFRFVRVDAGKPDARWADINRRFQADPPALVYSEGVVLKAIRAPHFADEATTRAKVTDFVEALIRNDYVGHVAGRRQSLSRDIPSPGSCSGGTCGRPADRTTSPQSVRSESEVRTVSGPTPSASAACSVWSGEGSPSWCPDCRNLSAQVKSVCKMNYVLRGWRGVTPGSEPLPPSCSSIPCAVFAGGQVVTGSGGINSRVASLR